jgi:hypothetical protein
MRFVPTFARVPLDANLAFLAGAVRKALLAGDHATIQNVRLAAEPFPRSGTSARKCSAPRESWELFKAVAASLDSPRTRHSKAPVMPPLSGVLAQIDLLEHIGGPALSEPVPPPPES